eukprot:gene5032-8629_t
MKNVFSKLGLDSQQKLADASDYDYEEEIRYEAGDPGPQTVQQLNEQNQNSKPKPKERKTLSRTSHLSSKDNHSIFDKRSSNPILGVFNKMITPTPEEIENEVLVENVFVTIFEAKELMEIDKGFKGEPDAFVVVSLEDIVKKTKICSTTFNPQWNEQFSFFPSSKTSEIKIEVFDFDEILNENTLIGECTITAEEDVYEGWIPLKKAKRGAIKVRIK